MARSSCVVTKGYSRFAMIARLIAAFATKKPCHHIFHHALRIQECSVSCEASG
jgi:hypothetical protein